MDIGFCRPRCTGDEFTLDVCGHHLFLFLLSALNVPVSISCLVSVNKTLKVTSGKVDNFAHLLISRPLSSIQEFIPPLMK